METILHGWPFVGLVAALGILGWVVWSTRATPDRLQSPAFVLGLLWPMYLLHQFEEHGIDLFGRRYAFLESLCRTLGHSTTEGCPADAPFLFVVNVVACQVAFAVTEGTRVARPLVSTFGWSIPLVNAFAHLGGAVRERAYNPGLATSLALFLPLAALVVVTGLRAKVLKPVHVPMLIGAGVVVHAVLMGSLLAKEAGLLSGTAVLALNGVNGVVPLLVGLVAERLSRS